ncbi:hypothetical protein [Sphingomonas sp. TDK1]|uniref:hypothetical protein n=1 Tax=Sphingomonas sp. TDK1 TaxID=453247 RepID=UPI0007D9D221|nr:hypothetical protein [Sphingomonas sp. TDK1]OAN66566.1 hypothetical protein A7X12_10560 [Sphingomonas sp. TDK1]
MQKLAAEIIDAHGGLDSWKRHDSLTAHLRQGGVLWPLKGQAGVLDETSVTVSLREIHASHSPFGTIAARSDYRPARVALLEADGAEVVALDQPRASFDGHTLETPWTPIQLAYFAGCAMWTYFNMPFLLAWDGVETEELAPWDEDGQRLRRLRVTLPPAIVSHSSVQTLYVTDEGLLARHDYDVEIAGGTPGAHYISGYTGVDGIRLPTRRRIYPRQPDGQRVPEPLVVSIDIDNYVFG